MKTIIETGDDVEGLAVTVKEGGLHITGWRDRHIRLPQLWLTWAELEAAREAATEGGETE